MITLLSIVYILPLDLDNQLWLDEKNALIQAHNAEKVKLISEIQNLRKALTPTAEQAFHDFKRSEYLRAALEEEVVNTHIQNDSMKVEFTLVLVYEFPLN